MAEKIIPLTRQYEAHGEVFRSVVIREPRWEDYLALGEPYEMQRAAGQDVVIENTETIAAYVKRCIVSPGAEKMGDLGVADSRKVRDAVIDFFRHASPPAAGG